ncbi:tyrosine-protein kinase SYK-like [Patella vulgata]|uniref:tyrosine-protein kinase SYK-like n=1 Tax=Patella vulgata TaxID=6465 RepID=UPI0024A8C02D|nr:tyrosine-protein kinase SYK-like [Patella vulgata]
MSLSRRDSNLGGPKRASSTTFFYGRITREEAEKILKIKGMQDGLFLLRESISPLGNYAVSICSNGDIHHYIIEKKADGQFVIPQGRKFPGPVELIEHYKNYLEGFVTAPTIPCERDPSQQAIAFRGMTYSDLEKEMTVRAKAIKKVAFGPMRDHLMKLVAKELHLKQPWFHGKLSRSNAESRMTKDGTEQGKFMVRAHDDKKTFALTLCHENSIKHYFININSEEKLSIEDGPKFECLIMLIDHYHNKQDGLACKLTVPCKNPSFSKEDMIKYMRTCNEALFSNQSRQSMSRDVLIPPERVFRTASMRSQMPVPPIPSTEVIDTDDPAGADEASPDIKDVNSESLESEYMQVRRREKRFELEPQRLTLQDELGSGQFGSVVKGICRMDKKKIPVAIKTLKNEELVPGVEPELYKEAKVMQELDHKNIVRLIGICKSDSIMLVLELAPLGPLNKFLQKNRDMKEVQIIRLMLQVAKGMAYLEKKKFVHRDLAARNVLLVDKAFAKISDFGMSKALSRENNYYTAEKGKWPLKWYALDCIYYHKFDSKSDVWSYGVTMWEALTYGDKPYGKMKFPHIVEFLEAGNRLRKPDGCSEAAYNIMMSCWKKNKDERPKFLELATKVDLLHQNLSLG